MSDSYQSLLKLEADASVPQCSRLDIDRYLYERYNVDSGKWLRRAFYLARPLISNDFRLTLRRHYSRIQTRRRFPAWPNEPIVVQAVDSYLQETVKNSKYHEIYRIGIWPERKTFALVLSHDIESKAGFDLALRLVEIEKEFGFTSSFYIVPERYPINTRVMQRLKAEGCEIGVQGLKHDGKLFQTRKDFERQVIKIEQYAREWDAAGFRSPSTLRNVDWMPEMQFEYDSSFPDTDPYEPQAGGCCSIWPFFIKDLVELPMTMPQDHTLFDILLQKDNSIWRKKADWIIAHGGMVLIDTHPDYMNTEEKLEFYRHFLKHMKSKQEMWHAHARAVARWWRGRNASSLRKVDGRYVIDGPIAERGSVVKTTLEDDHLKNEFWENE